MHVETVWIRKASDGIEAVEYALVIVIEWDYPIKYEAMRIEMW